MDGNIARGSGQGLNAIREGESGSLDTLCKDVWGYEDRISDILSRIDSYMDKLPTYYQGPPCKKLIERYGSLQASYPIIKANIESYAEDFITLKAKMHEGDAYFSRLVDALTSDTHDQIKANNFNLK